MNLDCKYDYLETYFKPVVTVLTLNLSSYDFVETYRKPVVTYFYGVVPQNGSLAVDPRRIGGCREL